MHAQSEGSSLLSDSPASACAAVTTAGPLQPKAQPASAELIPGDLQLSPRVHAAVSFVARSVSGPPSSQPWLRHKPRSPRIGREQRSAAAARPEAASPSLHGARTASKRRVPHTAPSEPPGKQLQAAASRDQAAAGPGPKWDIRHKLRGSLCGPCQDDGVVPPLLTVKYRICRWLHSLTSASKPQRLCC